MDYSTLVRDTLIFLNNYQGILTILGWFTVFWFAIQASKIQIRNNTRLEIYKEFQELKSKVDESLIELGSMLNTFSLPFLEMEYAEENILGKEKKSPNEIWIERNGIFIDTISTFSERWQKFISSTAKWSSIMPKLKKARNTLSSELNGVTTDLWNYYDFLGSQLDEYDWNKWDRGKIEKETEDTRNVFDKVVGGFLTDYMDLIHNELIHPIFNVKSVPREDFNYIDFTEAETLTTDGIQIKKYQPMEGAKIHHKKRLEKKK